MSELKLREIGPEDETAWVDSGVVSLGYYLLEGTKIVSPTVNGIANYVLEQNDLRTVGVPNDLVEEFASENDESIIRDWVSENSIEMYGFLEDFD